MKGKEEVVLGGIGQCANSSNVTPVVTTSTAKRALTFLSLYDKGIAQLIRIHKHSAAVYFFVFN